MNYKIGDIVIFLGYQSHYNNLGTYSLKELTIGKSYKITFIDDDWIEVKTNFDIPCAYNRKVYNFELLKENRAKKLQRIYEGNM